MVWGKEVAIPLKIDEQKLACESPLLSPLCHLNTCHPERLSHRSFSEGGKRGISGAEQDLFEIILPPPKKNSKIFAF